MMKAVLLDGYTLNPGDLDWNPIRRLADLTVYDRTSFNKSDAPLIVERSKGAEILLVNKTPVTREIMDQIPELKYIGLLSTGYDVVDIVAAKEKGIVVTNVPTYGTDSVAQMAFALLLEMCSHVGEHNAAVKRGDWTTNKDWCFWNYPMIELSGKTLGIIGYGRIGQASGKIAQAMNMKVLAFDAYKNPSLETEQMKYVEMDELFAEADIIFLHCPLTPETNGIINKNNIAKMKDGVMLINNSRGPLVNEADLAEALNGGKIAGAALDVVSTEPIKVDNPLLTASNCIITPHISWASKEARSRIMDMAAENLESFQNGNLINVVNR
jgi:glycerate dehydrogenase